MNDFICYALKFGLIGMMISCLSLTLNRFMQPGHIFFFWFVLVNMMKERGYRWIAEPLGACIFCMNIWVNIFAFVGEIYYFMPIFEGWHLLLLIAQCCISNVFLRKIYQDYV